MSHRPTRRRLVRAAAGATAGVVLGASALVAAQPAAAAAGSGSPILYRATTGTGVVQLVLTLPAGAAALPIPRPAVLTLVGTDGAGLHSAGTPDVARTDSFLAGGSLIIGTPASAALSPLGRVLTADLAHPHPVAPPALTVPPNPLGLKLGVGAQTASVQPTTSSTASSTLAKASLGSLDALGLAPVLDPVSSQLTAATTALTTAAKPLTDGIKKVPAPPSVPPIPNPLQPIIGGPSTISPPALGGPALAAAINELPAQVRALLDKLRNGAVVQLDGLDTGQGISPATSSATATGHTNLADLQLFGGLVVVKASQATATATAGLTKSDAAAGASATLVQVTVSDAFGTLLQAVASDKGVTASLLDGALANPSPERDLIKVANAALDTLLQQLTDVLMMLNSGAKLIKQGTATHTVSPDGHTAQAHAVPAQVTLGLPGAPNLVQVSVGRADAVAAVATPVAPVAPVAVGAALPRTGLEQGGTAAAALLLVSGLGLVALRRRRLNP
jgi:LPXTG-motif cell wall-anchored protein